MLFLERDQPWYAAHRDLPVADFCELAFYRNLTEIGRFEERIAKADAVMVGSFVPDGIAIGSYVQRRARGVSVFYDIDTPVTLAKLSKGECKYLARELIPFYGLYLSFTGGPTLDLLMRDCGSPAAHALYCSVDPNFHKPTGEAQHYDLGYLGTYSQDRQDALERLMFAAARRAPHLSFVVGGPQYPSGIDWPPNVGRVDHVAPAEHPAFYSSCRFLLNVTRADMLRAGHSPSVRLFEAAACGVPIISDYWEGLDSFFAPPDEIALASDAGDVLALIEGMDEPARRAMAEGARERVLAAHTAEHRAQEFEHHILGAIRRAGSISGRARPKFNRALGGGLLFDGVATVPERTQA